MLFRCISKTIANLRGFCQVKQGEYQGKSFFLTPITVENQTSLFKIGLLKFQSGNGHHLDIRPLDRFLQESLPLYDRLERKKVIFNYLKYVKDDLYEQLARVSKEDLNQDSVLLYINELPLLKFILLEFKSTPFNNLKSEFPFKGFLRHSKSFNLTRLYEFLMKRSDRRPDFHINFDALSLNDCRFLIDLLLDLTIVVLKSDEGDQAMNRPIVLTEYVAIFKGLFTRFINLLYREEKLEADRELIEKILRKFDHDAFEEAYKEEIDLFKKLTLN